MIEGILGEETEKAPAHGHGSTGVLRTVIRAVDAERLQHVTAG
jgi:hypothetical protein